MSELFSRVKTIPTLDVVTAFFPHLVLKRDGSGRGKALCPFHAEDTPSFTVFEDGWKCFGCGAHGSNVDLLLKAGLASKPLEAARVIAERFGIEADRKAQPKWKSLTLAEYYTYVNLPQEFMAIFHLEETQKGIAIPYRDENSAVVGVQLRHRFEKGKGRDARFSWKEGKPYLYGAWALPRWKDKETKRVLLCEGASDVHVCWFHGIPALGIPGAGCFKAEWVGLLLPFSEIAIIQEPGEAGGKFVKSITDALKGANYQGQVKAVSLAEKDPRDLWLKRGERFKDELEAAIEAAAVIDLYPPVPLTYDLISKVADLLGRHVFFKDKRIPLLIATWVLGTYVYETFTYFGYLWLNSPVKRCGKSLLEDILSNVCCRATSRVSNLTESVIFHLAHKGKTLIVDELENLRAQDKDKYGAVMSVLNTGFQAGSKVYRMQRTENGFEEQEFNAFCPKVLAGISHLNDTIEDRAFKIAMVRKTWTEKVKRFSLRRQADELDSLREALRLWAEERKRDIETIYDNIEEIEELGILDDRFKDIAEPLVAIASYADAEATNSQRRIMPEMVPLLLDMGGKREENAKQEAIGGFTLLADEILGAAESVFVPTSELLKKTAELDELSWLESTRALGKFLSRFDLTSTKRRGEDGKQTRGFVLTREWVEEARNRYFVTYPDLQTSQTSLDQAGSGSEPLFANVPEGVEGHHENSPQTRMGVRRGTSGTSPNRGKQENGQI